MHIVIMDDAVVEDELMWRGCLPSVSANFGDHLRTGNMFAVVVFWIGGMARCSCSCYYSVATACVVMDVFVVVEIRGYLWSLLSRKK